MDRIPFEELQHAERRTFYVQYEDGSAGLIETTSEEPPLLSKPGAFINEDAYMELRRVWEVATAELVDALQAADLDRLLKDFRALLDLGIPVESARRLTGYDGAWPLPDSGGDV
ncbi:hypothetical protein [Streptomyces carpinensis]|uniref:Uncharacterized protein n=1 Tax=Streptomyces carpinensis TaxID=66369 RepID=A0ABV1W5K2_9ACTN|nr:hypothetical protein [Streptomyces carpinensis]